MRSNVSDDLRFDDVKNFGQAVEHVQKRVQHSAGRLAEVLPHANLKSRRRRRHKDNHNNKK